MSLKWPLVVRSNFPLCVYRDKCFHFTCTFMLCLTWSWNNSDGCFQFFCCIDCRGGRKAHSVCVLLQLWDVHADGFCRHGPCDCFREMNIDHWASRGSESHRIHSNGEIREIQGSYTRHVFSALMVWNVWKCQTSSFPFPTSVSVSEPTDILGLEACFVLYGSVSQPFGATANISC